MQGYGDVSGHFRNLLTGQCDVVVVGVVFGDQIKAGRCARKAVRRVQDIDEAKWRDLTEVQKRRVIECFADNDLEFGCAKFTRERLQRVTDQYLLYQDVCFPPRWDLALTGYAYGEILFEKGARDAKRVIFTFDQVASNNQSKALANHIQDFVPGAQPIIGSSHQQRGIQSADCFAGAVAEDHNRGTSWIDSIDEARILECSHTTLVQLENDLHRYDR